MLRRPESWSDLMRRRDYAAIADWFIYYFVWIGCIGLVTVGLAAGWEQSVSGDWKAGLSAGLRIFSLSALFAAASAFSGWLLGLLFGIPRSLAEGTATTASGGATPSGGPGQGGPTSAQAGPGGNGNLSSIPNGTSPPRSTRTNTNLEDISDWLTKTIVGVGLTQLFSVPHYIWHAAEKLNDAGFNWPNHGQLLAISLFFYYGSGGFWLGYVGTRTILTRFLEAATQLSLAALEMAGDPNNLLLAEGGVRIAGAPDPQVARADQALRGKSLQELGSVQEKAAWAAAQARAGDLASARIALTQALQTEPNNAGVKELFAIVYSAAGDHPAASRLLADLPPTDIAVFNALYEPPPSGFSRAITVGEQLLPHPDQAQNANLRVWMACAYGQKYRYERDVNHAESAVLDSIKALVVREIQAALHIDLSTKQWLHSLWRPAPGAQDDDLAALSDDPDVVRLLT